MAIVDGKGRLFGRINLIDLAALCALVLLLLLFLWGYRLYSFNYRERVRKEVREEWKEWKTRRYLLGDKVVIILYARIPGYLRNVVAVGDAEAVDDRGLERPMTLLGRLDAKKTLDADLLLLRGLARKSPQGVWYAGKDRPLRLGESLAFKARQYRITGKIVRLLTGKDANLENALSVMRGIRVELEGEGERRP